MADNILKTKAKDPTDAIFGVSPESEAIHFSISDAPHFLVAGTTGSGKSVFINNLLITMMAHATPEELKIAIIDPKQVEFTAYKGLPHMLADPVIKLSDANDFITYLTVEMDRRYGVFKDIGVKNLPEYNEKVRAGVSKDDPLYEKISQLEPLPYIVTVIDEFSDLIGQYKEVEKPVIRIGQKARAAGIHAIIATQSPRREVITGLIKANFPSRVSLMVAGSTESQIILDETGGEKLKPKGDMLIKMNGGSPINAQSPFQTNDEIARVFDWLRENYEVSEPVDFKAILKSSGDEDSLDGDVNSYQRSRSSKQKSRREQLSEERMNRKQEEEKDLPKEVKVDTNKVKGALEKKMKNKMEGKFKKKPKTYQAKSNPTSLASDKPKDVEPTPKSTPKTHINDIPDPNTTRTPKSSNARTRPANRKQPNNSRQQRGQAMQSSRMPNRPHRPR